MPATGGEEPVNLLALDGGGVRGVASLLILHEIMVRIQEICKLDRLPKPCEYFHMIGGTSTGGLIAIMLGRLRMSTEEALQEYDRCAKKVFSFRNKKWTTATEKFRATALKEVVEDLVRRRGMGTYLEDHKLEGYDEKGQCFVCVMPASGIGEPRRLRSFASVDKKDHPGVKIWEAARATTAASFFFKPMTLRVGKRLTEDYVDAAIGCNNPAKYLLQEAKDQFGTGRRLGCLISIGTGTRVVKIGRAKRITQTFKFAKELLGTLKNTATDSEETHRALLHEFRDYRHAYFRFNVPGVAEEVKLHHYLRIGHLKSATAAYLTDTHVGSEIFTAADTLARPDRRGHGLTLGHVVGVDKDQVVLSTLEARPLGHISPFFTGRADILDRLDACFAERNTGGKPRRQFLLHGQGGVGKTQIALKAADVFEKRFAYIFHVDAANRLTATQSLAKICQEYRPEDCVGLTTNDEMKDRALWWINRLSDEWLMIYDNYAEKEHFDLILPRSNTGNIIYTCRSQGYLGNVLIPIECVCEVEPFREEDAVDLLLKVAGREHLKSDASEMQAAREIVRELGYLPLAIESAGAYMREGDCGYISYLQRFRDKRIRPTLFSTSNADGSSPARPALYTTLDLSYDAIVSLRRRNGRSLYGRAAECALQALNLLCFYHNEGIPAAIFERATRERVSWGSHGVYSFSDLTSDPFLDPSYLLAPKFPEGAWNGVFYQLGVQLLHRFALVKLSGHGDRVSMHVMVQAWAQDRLEKHVKPGDTRAEDVRPQQALFAKMVLVESIVVSWSNADRSWLSRLPSHVTACLAHAHADVTHDPYQAILEFKLGWYFKHEKQFPSAEKHLAGALRIWKYVEGAYSESVVEVLSELGDVYHSMGRMNDAELTYLEILDRLRLRVDGVREAVRERRAGLKRKLVQQRRLAPLSSLRQLRYKAIRQKTGEEEPVGDAQDKTGSQSSGQPESAAASAGGDDRGARPVEETIAAIETFKRNKQRGGSQEDLDFEHATALTHLAMLRFDQGRFTSGKELVLKAIALLERGGHPDDIRVWALEDELIRRFEGGGNLDHWARRTAALRSLPQDYYDEYAVHEYAVVWPLGYAAYLEREGSWHEAYRVYETTLEMCLRGYGPSDRRSLNLLRRMAWCQLQQGLFEQAEEHARTAVDRARACYGRGHFLTAECLDMLSVVLMYQTLDVLPGSEFWRVTQEAYDAVRVSFSENHYLAVTLKERLDNFGSIELARGNGERRDEKVDGFDRVVETLFADGYPATREESMAKTNAAYREHQRRELQAKAQKRMRPKSKPPPVAEAGPSTLPATSNSRSSSSSSTSTSTPQPEAQMKPLRPESRQDPAPRHRSKWKGKERADPNLSPIIEDKSSFEDGCVGGSHRSTLEEIQCELTTEETRGKGKGKAELVSRLREEKNSTDVGGKGRGGHKTATVSWPGDKTGETSRSAVQDGEPS